MEKYRKSSTSPRFLNWREWVIVINGFTVGMYFVDKHEMIKTVHIDKLYQISQYHTMQTKLYLLFMKNLFIEQKPAGNNR